jgi:hypothetical protein
MIRRLARGLAAGATGTIALELTTYLDMLVRGRPPSDQPDRLGSALSDHVGFAAGEDEAATSRRSGLGSAFGYIDGLALPVLYAAMAPRRDRPVLAAALLLSVGAMIGSNGPAVAFGLTDPRTWSLDDWLTDAVPHLVYGFVTATTYELLTATE